MTKFTFHMGINPRAYGNVEVEADTIEQAVAKLTAGYVAENFTQDGSIDQDHPQFLTIIDVRENGVELEDHGQQDLPGEYDPKPELTDEQVADMMVEQNDKVERRLIAPMLAALKAGRDALAEALTTHIYDEQNGEKPEPDCVYTAAVRDMTAILARFDGTPAVVESTNKSSDEYLNRFPVEARPYADRAYEDGFVDGAHSSVGRLAVVIEGGMLSAVVSDGPLVGLEVTTIDYDTDGHDDEGPDTMHYLDGSEGEKAFVSSITIEEPSIAWPETIVAPTADELGAFASPV